MKRIIQISVLLLLCTLAYGGNVTKEQALQKALQFTNSRPHVVNGKRLALGKKFQLREAKGERKGFYAFNIGEQNGFVLVSADDRTPAILGYASKGTYNVDDMPENMRAWLQGYADQMDYLEKHPGANVLSTAQLDEHTPIAPMLTSTWNQSSPYNNMCPFDGGYRSVTGCVATAMAQVLYYHRYPAQTTATIPAYTTETNGISVDEIGITSIDWNNMLDNYTGSETTLQKKAVANLMKLCGASVEMDYSSSSSGASGFMAEPALKNYFGYDASTFMADRSDYRAKEWNDLVYDELANNRPVFYTGQSLGGGHAFVIDGYDEDGYFHVNWGWGGYCDSYFLLSILDPDSNDGIGASSSTDGYSFYQGALIGAQPYTGQPNSNAIMTIYTMTVENSVIAKQDDVFPISAVGEIYNMTNETINFELGLGIYTKDNELLYAESNGNEELESGWGWTSLELGANVPALPDGDYIITTISRNMGTTKWHQSLGSTKCYAIATIAGDQLTLKMPITDLSGSMEIVGDQKVGNQLTVKTTIDNNGTPFNDIFWLFVNDHEVGAQHFDIAGGDTDILEMSFTLDSEDESYVSLGYFTYVWDDTENVWQSIYNEVASTTIGTGEEPELASGTYYLRNVATQKFWGAGNNWGTKASLVDEYQYAQLKYLSDGNYTLESMVSNGGSAYYFNGDFMDNANPVELTFTKQDNGYYTIANGDNYYGYDGSTTVLGKNLAADSENALWEVLTEEEIINEKNTILSSATADNPVDATFLIQNAGFGRNRIDGAWEIYNSWNYNLGGPNASEGNYCAESYHSTFQLEQNIDAPKGVYKLTAQGFYRQDGTDNDDLPYFFAYCYETGESSNARFPYKTGSESSMADAANSFENGLYTSDPMYIEMPSDGMMAIGAYLAENVDLWCIWDNFHLTYYGPDADINALKNAGLIASYEKALADATEALTDEEYTIVAGEERENLSAVIAEHENVGTDETSLQNALEALTEATETFKMAKASYKRLADVLSLIGQYPYASASKTAAIESYKTYAPTSADDATTKLQTWQPAIRRYVESNALLESIEGSIDMTNSIQNPNAEDGKNGWTTILATPGYINVLSGEPLTDADGYSGYSYFDGGNWSGTDWNVSLEQKIELPKGHYLLSVSSRASAGLSTFCLYAGDNRKEMLHIGAAQGLFGNGWNDAFVEFELEDDAMINIGVQGKATPVQNWMSFTRFRLAKFPIPTETVTVTAAGYATYVSDNNLDYSEVQGLTAYKANVSGATISFEKVTTVPAGEGVLLKGEGVFEVPQVNNVAPWTDDHNAFIRGTGAAVETGSGPYNYILNNVGGIVGFYRANNQVVAKNRAYIQTTVNAARLSISFDDEESTDVHTTFYQESSGNTTFNLNGQRVEKPQKGLYVKEGRKVIFK